MLYIVISVNSSLYPMVKRISISFSVLPTSENFLVCIVLISAHSFATKYSSTPSGYAPELSSL